MTNSPSFSISPDGRRLAFVATGSDGARRLWIRALDSIEARPLAGSETIPRGIRNVPFWSPDGRYVAFDAGDRKSTRLNSSHLVISYAVFCLKKKKNKKKL